MHNNREFARSPLGRLTTPGAIIVTGQKVITWEKIGGRKTVNVRWTRRRDETTLNHPFHPLVKLPLPIQQGSIGVRRFAQIPFLAIRFTH